MGDERARLLIVDDDCEIRNVLREFLGSSYYCVASNSAEEALGLLATEAFDLIMTDITMARMTGLQLVPHILALAPDSVIVMISGQRTIEYAIEAMRAGAFDYITKPFDLAEVNVVVNRALAHRTKLRNARRGASRHDESARELRHAVENKDFLVYYQPQVEIESKQIVGMEALARWQHPQKGLLLPVDFIPLAEETGLIEPIGAFVLQAACAQTRQWQDAGFRGLRVAVNVSPRQLGKPDFPDTVAKILNEVGLEAKFLEIEVTETSFMQNAESGIHALTRLREMGVRIASDDFGTGYSSLSYLKRLPIDSVKLDASFVKDATRDPDDAALVMAIITLAHNLRLRVIAEGIETEDQLAFLRLLRCDEGQGYFFGRPASPDVIRPLLKASNDRNQRNFDDEKQRGFDEIFLSASPTGKHMNALA